jgi:8-oxo-dGTP pyrophosphatase MutT (NUDIX family)
MHPSEELPTRRYTAAGGVVADASGRRVLLLLRPQRPGPDGNPEVRLPKGHVEPGESPEQAAVREVREEAGLPGLEIVASLGRQTVEFDWDGQHVIREEFYFLMTLPADAELHRPEDQFERLWLPWEHAARKLTFEAEREWVKRAQIARNRL